MTERPDLNFGECPECGGPIERVWWDEICFACQDEDDEDTYIAAEPAGEAGE